jgi:hypothetical protein
MPDVISQAVDNALFINTTLSITYKVATSLERQNRNSTPAKRMAVTTRRKMQLSSAAQ